MQDTIDDSSQASPSERRVVAGRPAFTVSIGGLRDRVIDSLVGARSSTLAARYRLGRVLGSGSFGIVYEAEDVRLGRRVAVKLIASARTPEETARVLREARMLATVSHPNIVHVFEVGLTDDHRRSPYVVMELVPGRTLRRWLADERPSWRDVVGVVVQAAHGLRAAHLAGVVHRDVKPDNILIGDDGRPRVIDFGLARELDDLDADPALRTSSGDSPDLTPTGQVVGTPAYMAPEVYTSQCTPLSDQYSLCVTLYEALFGTRPFQASSTDELREQILLRDPKLPADRRRIPARVQRIVMRGLRRDPARRHADLSALIDRLERALRPARAFPGLVIGGGLLTTTAVLAAGRDPACLTADRAWADAPTTTGAIDRARAEYERAWRDAEQQLCAAGDGVLAAEQRRCLDDRARDALALITVISELDPADPQADGDALRTLPPPADCAGPEPATVAPPDPRIAVRIERLEPALSRLRALTTTMQVSAGLELAASLAAEVSELDYGPMIVDVGYLRGRLLFQASDYSGAAAAFEDTFLVAQREQLDRIAASSATQLLRVHGFYRGDLDTARRWAAHAEAAFVRAGLDPLTESTYLLGLAGIAEREGDPQRAVELLQQAIEANEGAHGSNSFRGTLVNHLGIALFRLGRHAECVTALQEAAALLEQDHGAVTPSRAAALDNLGLCLVALDRHDEALDHHREALAIRDATLDPQHTDLGASHGNIAEALDLLGRPDEALPHIEQAHRIFAARLGDEHPWIAQTLAIRGRIRMHAGQLAAAADDLARAARMYDAAGAPAAADLERVQMLVRELEARGANR